jgi:aspartyl/glutamyl-tRNA(Asn/Gln) amidotransferase C subunit
LEEVKKLALLARIEMDKKELEELQKDLEAILSYVSQLKKAPLPSLSGAVHNGAPEISNVFREDEPINDESGIERGEYIRVKHIL